MLCRDCHAKTGCQVIHPDVVTNKCDGCGAETLCVDCQMIKVEDLKNMLGGLAKHLEEITAHVITQEEVTAAADRYPGMPLTLAITRYMIDQLNEGGAMGDLHERVGWGGVHLERVGVLVQQIVEAMYKQSKKSVTIKLECEGFPWSWDHIYVQIMKVQGGEETNDTNQ